MKTSRLPPDLKEEHRLRMLDRKRRYKERVALYTTIQPGKGHDARQKHANRLIGMRGVVRGASFHYSCMRHLTPKRQSVRERLRG